MSELLTVLGIVNWLAGWVVICALLHDDGDGVGFGGGLFLLLAWPAIGLAACIHQIASGRVKRL